MATLAQATQTTRTVLKWMGILLAVFIIIRSLFIPLALGLYNRLFPKTPPPPTVSFGKLPKIAFPPIQLVTTTYTIQTTTGQLPANLPNRVFVYPVFKEKASFTSYDRARQKVASVGFRNEGVAISPTVYKWTDEEKPDRSITFNVVTQAFTLENPTTTAPADTEQGRKLPPQSAQAISIAKNFLSKMSLLPQDLDDTKTKITFLKSLGGTLAKATSLSESDFTQVDFYRKPVDDIPVVNENPSQSLITFLLKTDNNFDLQVVKAKYVYTTIDNTQGSTYPIKTPQEAFENLKNGNAYIPASSSLTPLRSGGNQAVGIQQVYLAYYESTDAMDFLLPVYVFEGDNNFIAYVSAIKDEWLE